MDGDNTMEGLPGEIKWKDQHWRKIENVIGDSSKFLLITAKQNTRI